MKTDSADRRIYLWLLLFAFVLILATFAVQHSVSERLIADHSGHNHTGCPLAQAELCTADGASNFAAVFGRGVQAVTVTRAEFTPFAITADGSDSSAIEITIEEAATAVNVKALFGSRPDLNGTEIGSGETVELFDDGTNGDRVAGDKIWSRGGLTYTNNSLSPGSFRNATLREIEVTSGSGTETINITDKFRPMLIYIAPSEITAVAEDPSNTIQIGTHSYNVYSPAHNGQLATNEREAMKAVGNTFFSYLDGDDVDFMIVFPTQYLANGAFGRAYPVQNSDQNIGQSVFDSTAVYGSPGQLKKAIIMNFGSTNGPTLHEMMHQWGAYGLAGLGFHNCNYGGHWGTVGIGRGQLGGFDPATLVDNNDGTFSVGRYGSFANGGDGTLYAQLELYLMGMIPASEVDPIPVPVNIDCNSFAQDGNKIKFKADSMRMVTIAEIQAELGGARVPSSATAQKAFNVAFVSVSDVPLTAAEMSFYNSRAQILSGEQDSFLNSFPEATGSRGTVDTTTKAPPPPIALAVDNIEPSSPKPGDSVTMTVSIQNSGVTPADGMVMTVTLPSQVSYVDATVAGPVTITPSGQNVAFGLGTLAASGSQTVKVIYQIPAGLTDTLTLTSQLSATGVNVSADGSHSIVINAQQVYLPIVVR